MSLDGSWISPIKPQIGLILRGIMAKPTGKRLAGIAMGISLLLAASPAAKPVTVKPEKITIAGSCLWQDFLCSPAKRTIVVELQQPIQNLQLLPIDLSSANRGKVFPSSSIDVEKSQIQLYQKNDATKSVWQVSLTFAFHNVPSGSYNGQLLLVDDRGNNIQIPVTIQVKDSWLLPVLLLILGVTIGYGLSVYRHQGSQRDAIAVQVGNLQTQCKNDSELPPAFQSAIVRHIVEAETALGKQQWETAQKAVNAAQAIWDKWRQYRDDWKKQLEYAENNLRSRVQEEIDPDTNYQQAILFSLEQAKNISAYRVPKELRDRLEEIRQQFQQYRRNKAKIHRYASILRNFSPEEEKEWRNKLKELDTKLQDLSPSEQDAIQEWQNELANFKQELDRYLQEKQRQENPNREISPDVGSRGNYESSPIEAMLQPPATNPFTQNSVQKARQRLQWFNWIAHATVIVLMVGGGFNKLYAEKPTFGRQGIADYLALLVWGFSAEVTRDAVVKAIRQEEQLLTTKKQNSQTNDSEQTTEEESQQQSE